MSEITTKTYWEQRYKSGGNSGAGSYGKLASFKGEIINDFAEKHNVKIAASSHRHPPLRRIAASPLAARRSPPNWAAEMETS
jgi:hypothetical protein